MSIWTRILIFYSAAILSCLAILAFSEEGEKLPDVICKAEQTGGFHDYPGGEEAYEPALFHPRTFTLEENLVFMMNLAAEEGNVDLYLTMTHHLTGANGAATDSDPAAGRDLVPGSEITELECRRVRGANDSSGFSCANLPPSEMLLINAQTLRYTRTAVGGWTFAGAAREHNGNSIFVEYGQCQPVKASALDR